MTPAIFAPRFMFWKIASGNCKKALIGPQHFHGLEQAFHQRKMAEEATQGVARLDARFS